MLLYIFDGLGDLEERFLTRLECIEVKAQKFVNLKSLVDLKILNKLQTKKVIGVD